MSSNNPDTDELAQQLTDAIIPIIDEHINDHQPDPPGDIDLDELADKLADPVADRIDLDLDGGITKADAEALIDDRIDDKLPPEIDLDDLADHVADRIETGGGGGGGVSEERIVELITEHIPEDAGGGLGSLGDELRLAYDPPNIGELNTGDPHGEMHSSTGFGPVYEAEQRCHLRGAVVDANERGTVTFRFYELADGAFDTEVVGDGPYRTRKVEVYGGEQYIPLEITFDEGHYFVSKDEHLETGSDEIVPLRRSTETPDGINDSDAPLNFVRGFHLDYRPSIDQNAYERFIDGEWADNYHYIWLCEVGYNDTPERGG